jgi:hypothetical protein
MKMRFTSVGDEVLQPLIFTPQSLLPRVHSKIHVADFTFMVRSINENRHTLSAYVFLR